MAGPGLTKKYCDLVVRKPCAICSCVAIFFLILTFAGLQMMAFTEQGVYDWVVTDSAESRNDDSLTLAKDLIDPLLAVNSSATIARRSKLPFALDFMFFGTELAEDILTAENLQQIC